VKENLYLRDRKDRTETWIVAFFLSNFVKINCFESKTFAILSIIFLLCILAIESLICYIKVLRVKIHL
jgi:hypothetical protein